MVPDKLLSKTVNGVRFVVREAFCIATYNYWDGESHERNGCNHFLYKTPCNHYFYVHVSRNKGERTTIDMLSLDVAVEAFECAPVQIACFEHAFPQLTISSN